MLVMLVYMLMRALVVVALVLGSVATSAKTPPKRKPPASASAAIAARAEAAIRAVLEQRAAAVAECAMARPIPTGSSIDVSVKVTITGGGRGSCLVVVPQTLGPSAAGVRECVQKALCAQPYPHPTSGIALMTFERAWTVTKQ